MIPTGSQEVSINVHQCPSVSRTDMKPVKPSDLQLVFTFRIA